MVRFPGCVSENVLNHHGIVFFIAFAGNVAEMRRAGDIIHLDQRMIGTDYRLFFVNIYRGHTRTASSERVGERIFRDQPRAAGVHEQRGRFHARQIVPRDDAAGIFVERQMQAQDIRLSEKLLSALGNFKSGGFGAAGRTFAPPADDSCAERSADAGDDTADFSIRINSQCLSR